jgi:Uma2 family endonuclease
MNIHVPTQQHSTLPDALKPRRWTADEFLLMVEKGIIDDGENLELIDGEIVSMAAKGRRHEIVRSEVAMSWARLAPPSVKIAQEPAFRLDDHNEPEPDIIVYPASMYIPDVRGPDALLVVEIAHTSLPRDMQIKAPLYARFGVVEYWVIDAGRMVTHVHRDPSPEGYGSIRMAPIDETLVPLRVPAFTLRLADLGFVADETM